MSDSPSYGDKIDIDAKYNTRLLQEHNVRLLTKKGFKVIETLDNKDIRLTKKQADCIVDVHGNVRWTDA